MTVRAHAASGYRLLAHELAVLDDDAPASEDGASAPADPAASEAPALVEAPAPIDDRDLAYAVRLIDAALLRVDAAVELVDPEPSFRELIALRDRALDR